MVAGIFICGPSLGRVLTVAGVSVCGPLLGRVLTVARIFCWRAE